MDALLTQLQQGAITFDAFYRETESNWRKVAADQFRKLGWRLQGSADLDDVFQEVVMSVPRSVADFDEARSGMGLSKFVVWRAYAAAKDFINQQCGSYRGRSCEPPRAPTIASMVSLPGRGGDDASGATTAVDSMLQRLSATDADQEWCMDVRARRAAVCETMVDHVVMTSLLEVGGSLDAMASAIFENKSLREELELTTEKRTYGMVRRATVRFVDRAAGMEI